MLTTEYTQGMVFSAFTEKVLRQTAPEILQDQKKNVEAYYNKRSGRIASELNNSIIQLSSSSGASTLTFNYLVDLRYMDMKRTKEGKIKKIYHPVYNRILWGYVYGYMYSMLRYGLNESVKREVIDELRNAIEHLDNK
jgi:Na+-transporting NADH:ubiquinone oxidoreductase subunit NqrC